MNDTQEGKKRGDSTHGAGAADAGTASLGAASRGTRRAAVQGAGAHPDDAERMARAQRCLAPLARWWDANARDFPWRFGRTSPWGVLVSEVMSQQTPMQRVLPYWTAWMAAWPTPAALAAASTAEVITAWGHLGYPRRALRLRECAQAICDDWDGEVPRDYDDLVALPGVGDYTASAVMSFAYGRRVPVIDTNIRRVLSRAIEGRESLGGSASAPEKRVIADCLPADDGQSVVWNQSVMELGAVVCTAAQPACESCPIAGECAFLAAGRPGLGQRRTRPRQRFQGTDRQVRGIVLHALREAGPGATLDYVAVRALWQDAVQLDACLASLDDDGLIVLGPNKSVSLPQ